MAKPKISEAQMCETVTESPRDCLEQQSCGKSEKRSEKLLDAGTDSTKIYFIVVFFLV